MKNIEIKGNANRIDSFAACITSGLHAWDIKFSVDYASGLSGAAFSPVWDKQEDCTSWWMEGANDNRICFLGDTLGFKVEKITKQLECTVAPDDPQIKPVWDEIKNALSEGKLVLQNIWPLWQIVTGWEDGKLKRAAFEGFEDLCFENPNYVFYILTKSEVILTRKEAFRQAIHFGADVADGTFTRPGYEYGGKLYDAAIEALGNEWFCIPCSDGQRDWSCCRRTLARIYGSQLSLVGFLDENKDLHGQHTNAFEEMSKDFQSMAATLLGYLENDNFVLDWKDGNLKKRLSNDLDMISQYQKKNAMLLRKISNTL